MFTTNQPAAAKFLKLRSLFDHISLLCILTTPKSGEYERNSDTKCFSVSLISSYHFMNILVF